MRFRTMQAGPVMQFPVFVVLFFAPVYVPLTLLQGWIHGVATVNPLTRTVEAGRGFISGQPTEVGLAYATGARAGGAVLALGPPRPAQRRSRRVRSEGARRSGGGGDGLSPCARRGPQGQVQGTAARIAQCVPR